MTDSKLSCRVTIIKSMPKMAARILIGFYSILFVDIKGQAGMPKYQTAFPGGCFQQSNKLHIDYTHSHTGLSSLSRLQHLGNCRNQRLQLERLDHQTSTG